MRQTLLAKQFIKESKNQEISPALFNSAVPIQTSGWNRDVYFNPYYKTRLPYPTFLSMKGKEGALFYCIDKTRKLGEEIFNACIQNPHHLKRIKKEYLQLSKQIQKIYIQTAELSIQNATEPQLKKNISLVIHAMWKLNARLFYTIPIDENLLTNLVELNKLPIPANRQKLLWETAVRYGGISFDTRRKIYFASQLSKGLSLHTLSEQLNYFYTKTGFSAIDDPQTFIFNSSII